jgi:hypothetical protein
MPETRFKLGKGASFFIKSQLKRLRQADETWEADFFPIPCSDSEHGRVWWGLVLSHDHEKVLAQRMVEEPPTVNDLANLLAEAMRRPLAEPAHRPQYLYLRARPEWTELLPHLKQIGIKTLVQNALPKWDRNLGDLQAQVEQARTSIKKGTPMARPRKPAAKAQKTSGQTGVRVYTLEVFLFSGPITERFAKQNPVVSRTIQIRGDQTLGDLHHAIFDAYGRWEEHLYEFQFGKGPMDPKGQRYVLPSAFEIERDEDKPPAGRVDETTIDSLGIRVGDRFGYWFDFGDDWWHQVNVEAIEDEMSKGKLPKVVKRVGKDPPQYADEDD